VHEDAAVAARDGQHHDEQHDVEDAQADRPRRRGAAPNTMASGPRITLAMKIPTIPQTSPATANPFERVRAPLIGAGGIAL
jgi:hypothetical protein